MREKYTKRIELWLFSKKVHTLDGHVNYDWEICAHCHWTTELQSRNLQKTLGKPIINLYQRD